MLSESKIADSRTMRHFLFYQQGWFMTRNGPVRSGSGPTCSIDFGPVAGPSVGMVFAPAPVGQHHRGFDLPFGDSPIAPQQAFFFLVADLFKTVPSIKADRPLRIGPGSDEDGPGGQLAQVRQKERADPSLLADRADVGMADERNVMHVLDA